MVFFCVFFLIQPFLVGQTGSHPLISVGILSVCCQTLTQDNNLSLSVKKRALFTGQNFEAEGRP